MGLNKLLPKIKLKGFPINKETGKHPLNRLKNYSRFAGVLGHSHVQDGSTGLECKYDPDPHLTGAVLTVLLEKKPNR
ncbi:MAG: hypothetical protein CM1200mP16_05640 [Nitrospina sp.]|nr:MAG: hypothetical protein CM1200mP16_05640 [Nitrospina sp.]